MRDSMTRDAEKLQGRRSGATTTRGIADYILRRIAAVHDKRAAAVDCIRFSHGCAIFAQFKDQPNHLPNWHSESIKKNWQHSAAAAGSVQLVGKQCVTAIEI